MRAERERLEHEQQEMEQEQDAALQLALSGWKHRMIRASRRQLVRDMSYNACRGGQGGKLTGAELVFVNSTVHNRSQNHV